MTDLNDFNIHAADWRKQLQTNERRTTYVITIYFIIYVALGLLIDTYLNLSPATPTLSSTLQALITFQIIPKATLIMIAIAAISLWITYHFYDNLMLMGTEYHEITPENAATQAEKQLYHVVEEMTVAAGMRYVPKVYIIDANYMNAFASGYSEKSAMVAITRGLMDKLDRSELQAVMAHELSHIRHGDIKLTLTASVLSNLSLMALDFLFYNMLFSSRNEDGERRGNNQLTIIIILLRYLLPLITMLLMFYLSRTREYMADAGSVELMRDNQPLARALLKIDQDYKNNANVYQQELSNTAHEDVRRASYLYDPSTAGINAMQSLNSLFSTHPDIKSRLAAMGIKDKN